MTVSTGKAVGTRRAEYGSDVVVDVLRGLGVEYVALNPGATFRGLHDSLVNYGGDKAPQTILCTHEEIAAAIAHGYARAAGKPMVAAVHNIVGLLHASMAMFNAWTDRAGMLVLGGTGPMAVEQRRPWIDWVHTALVQGNAVRDFVKWDDQPASFPSIVDSIVRGYHLAAAEPQGPVYLCFDASLQEQRLDPPLEAPDLTRYAPPTRVQADPAALARATALLVDAQRPVVIADYLGKDPEAVASLVRLAEGLALPVVDVGDLFSFPSRHPLNVTGAAADFLRDADVVLCLDVPDLQQLLATVDARGRGTTPRIPSDAKVIDISLRQYTVRSWVTDYGRLHPVTLSITADTALAVPALANLCLEKQGGESGRASAVRQRAARISARSKEVRQGDEQTALKQAAERPISLATLAQQARDVVQGHDWVVGFGDARGWVRKLWDFQHPYQFMHTRGGGGLGSGLGRALGVALAHRGTGRVCIDFQPDGDMLYTPSSLWTAAHHRIPLLVIMCNNRTYYNDEGHQEHMARVRGRPVENKVVGIRLEDPEVDFAAMARSFGIYGEGPIEDPAGLRPALERALRTVVEEGRPALVDVVTQRTGAA